MDYRATGAVEIVPINENGVVTNFTIGTSESQILTTAKVGRRNVSFQNVGSTNIYIRYTTGVTISGATRGWLLAPGASLDKEAGEQVTFFAISDAAAGDLQADEF